MDCIPSPTVAVAFALILTGCASSGAGPSGGAPAYPLSRTVDVADDYHGTRVADPYRWLEQVESPEVRAWAAAQNELAIGELRGDPLRARLLARMRELGAPWEGLGEHLPTRVGVLEVRIASADSGTHHVLTVRRSGETPRVLVDPRMYGPAMDVRKFQVSPDERYVSYALSDAGSEWVETRIHDVSGGRDLPEVLHGLLFDEPVWTRDGAGFFYVRQERGEPGSRTMLREPSVWYHAAGTAQQRDVPVFRTPAGTTDVVLEVSLTSDGRYAVVYEGNGAHVEGIGWMLTRMHLLDLGDPLRPDVRRPLVPLSATRDAAYRVIAAEGETLYLLTDRGAPRRRLVAVDVRDPAPARWRDVVPQEAAVLDRVVEIHGRLVALYLHDVQHRLRVLDREGRPVRELALPPMSTVLEVRPGEQSEQIDVATMSFLRPPSVTRHNVVTGAATDLYRPELGVDTARYEARQLWYRSRDGTRVPMFLVHRRGLTRDGSHPTILYGYGASAQTMGPGHSGALLAWLELGGVFAMPSLRGGGEFGREWYEAAILARKQTTFDDFIAAAEWLIAERYTSPARLAIQGASYGGLLVAATMAQRPELFAAAIAEVPGVDVLRNDPGRHRAQFGYAQDAAHFPFLLAYAPLQRIQSGTCYPATLVTTALNDERAPAWHAFKLTAALQTAQGCAKPIVLRADTAGGHLGSRGPDAWIEDAADVMTFAARRLGKAEPPR